MQKGEYASYALFPYMRMLQRYQPGPDYLESMSCHYFLIKLGRGRGSGPLFC